MDAGDWISLGGGVIACAAAGIAIWQGVLAKRSAASAGRQAVAAEQQVAIMARQLAYQVEDRDDAAGPRFEVLSAVITDDRDRRRIVAITVAQTLGDALASVSVSARQSDNVAVLRNPDSSGPVRWGVTAPGAIYKLRVLLTHNYVTPVNVVLDFDCTEANGERTWRRTLTATPEAFKSSWSRGFTFW
ncbi:hypothetical protein ACH4LK_14750 [Streptomyces lydicus]|uniref:hypothetical protein n=1 Tax=Streptomyces lydicus TaxID=47763 RepID=UPI0037B5C851